jgi:hypothetical protein
MVDFALESEIEGVKAIEPDVPGDFVSALSPDAFLFVKSWLVGREVLDVNPGMTLQKELDFITLVPVGSVHIEVYGIASKCPEHMLQHLQEPLAVASGRAYQPFPPQQGRHPAREVEPFPMLAGGGHFEPLALNSPPSPQPGMEAKASLILKHDGLIGLELGQFFLTLGESSVRPWPGLEDKHSRPFSGCSPSGAASTGPAVSSASLQSPFSGELPALVRPTCSSAGQTPGEASPGLAVAGPSTRVSVGPDAPVGAWAPMPECRSGLHHEPIVPESCDLGPAKRLLFLDAGPPKPAAGQQSLALAMPPEFASPGPAAFPSLPRNVPDSTPS